MSDGGLPARAAVRPLADRKPRAPVALSDRWVDRNDKPVGTDFSSFYATGSLVLEGRAAEVYHMAAHFAREQQIFGAATPCYGWLYPPLFLFVAAPLAMLPDPLALIVGFEKLQSVFAAIRQIMAPCGVVMRRATETRTGPVIAASGIAQA